MSTLRKLGIVTMAAAVGVTAIAVPASVDAAKSFSDVSAKNVYAKEISAMAEQGVIFGYPDGTFRPTEKITRKHAAALISRAFDKLPADSSYANKTASDVSAKNAYKVDIDKVIKAGVIVPDAKGNFRPNDLITRGEMAQALAKAYQLDKAGLTGKDATFIDKAKMNSFTAANLLYKAGITTGYDDNTFREKEGLSRAHYAVFMYRAANLAKAEAPTKPTKPVEETKVAPEVQEIIDSYLSIKKAGAVNLDKAAEDRQEVKNWKQSVTSNKFNESTFSPTDSKIVTAKSSILQKIGYTEKESSDMLRDAINGKVVRDKSSTDQHVYIYFSSDNMKLVLGIERLDM